MSKGVVLFTREEKVEAYLALQAWVAILEARYEDVRGKPKHEPEVAQALKAAVRAMVKVDVSIAGPIEEGIIKGVK